jgi:predicted ester cyclase
VVLSYFHDVLDGRKIGLLGQLFLPDCVINRPEGTLNGIAGIRGVVERNIATYSTFETQVHDIFESGDRVVVRITHRAMGAGAFRSRIGVYDVKGKSVTWDAIVIFRFQNGKIAEQWVSRDELGILLSLGSQTSSKRGRLANNKWSRRADSSCNPAAALSSCKRRGTKRRG